PGVGTTREAGSLDIGTLADDFGGIPRTPGMQLVEKELEEVVVDLGGVEHADLTELERTGSPQRDLLEPDEVRASALDLVREQPSAHGEVGVVDDGPGRLGAVRERDEDLSSPPAEG